MTRIPNQDSLSNEGLMSIESLLQTHNDLILSIHKSFTESHSNINRNINNLTDEVRQLKTQFQKVVSDHVLKDELAACRSHSEQALRTQEDRHRRDVDMLVDVFKKAASFNTTPAAAPQAQPSQFYDPMQQAHLIHQAQQAMFSQPGYVDPIQQFQYMQQMAFLAQQQHQVANVMSTAPLTSVSVPATAPAISTVVPNQNKVITAAPAGSLFGTATEAPTKSSAITSVSAVKPNVTENREKTGIQAPKPPVQPTFGQFGNVAKDQTSPAAPLTALGAKPALPFAKVEFVKSEVPVNSSTPPVVTAPSTLPSLSEQFKPKPGSWSCPSCMVNNGVNVNVCPCCNTSRDGKTQGASPANASFGKHVTTEASKALPDFTFGCSTGLTSSVGTNKASATSTTNAPAATTAFGGPPVFGNTAKPSLFGGAGTPSAKLTGSIFGGGSPSAGGSPFGGAQTTPQTTTTSPAAVKPSLFGGAKVTGGATGFAALANNATSDSGFLASSSPSNKASFGDPKNFQLFTQQKSATTEQPLKDTKKKDNESDNEAEDFVPDAHYEPVVPLPALVEAKTGEEDEEVLFVARCKLYRFDKDTKENKERGLGEIKVLRNSKTDRYRCVMRRDQVLKVCANFPIHASFKITPKPHLPTAYYWSCKDYTEDTNGSDEVLCARFKDAGTADQFAKTIVEAANQAGKPTEQQQIHSGTTATQKVSNIGFGSPAGSSNPKSVPDLLEHSNNSDNKANNKSAVDKEYDEEYGGYNDEYDEEEDDEEEEQLIAEEVCTILVTDEFVSPLKKTGQNSVPHRCRALFYDSSGIVRVSFVAMDQETESEVFSHFISMSSAVNLKGPTNYEYRAQDHGTAASKRVDLRFESADAAKRFKNYFEKGVKMAEETNFDEDENQD
ncbi:ranBP1 domain-containing protein [Ditylenchus destructor]|nr:ranBP1 domain-containing protein [Ditylenchus destructor]